MEKDLEIVDFKENYRSAFKELNEEWISTYFTIEESDVAQLNNPESYVIDKGGFIKVALYNNEVVGIVAMLKVVDDNYGFELSKMAVSPKVHGKKIAYNLAIAAIEQGFKLTDKKIYLVSNTILVPAINLYTKLGFVEVPLQESSYSRANIQMELSNL